MATNFENFLISPDFPINFRKSHQISKNYLKSSESYGQKPLGGVPKDHPGLNRVKAIACKIENLKFFEQSRGTHPTVTWLFFKLEAFKVCSINFEPPAESPLNECSPSAIMALSCENDIFMARSYKQSLPKVA